MLTAPVFKWMMMGRIPAAPKKEPRSATLDGLQRPRADNCVRSYGVHGGVIGGPPLLGLGGLCCAYVEALASLVGFVPHCVVGLCLKRFASNPKAVDISGGFFCGFKSCFVKGGDESHNLTDGRVPSSDEAEGGCACLGLGWGCCSVHVSSSRSPLLSLSFFEPIERKTQSL